MDAAGGSDETGRRDNMMRGVQHRGRVGSAGHNDRLRMERAGSRSEHIDTERTIDNWYMTWDGDISDLEASERRFYEKNFRPDLEAKNERYKQQRHPERCKTMDQVYTGRNTRPEEIIMQIGDKDDHPSAEAFLACVDDYIFRLETWSAEHGNPFTILSVATHLDEATPHSHIRQVWHYTDNDGLFKIGQEQALARAGVERPDPETPGGRRNNRKMTYTAMAREMWLDVIQEHGLQVEREAIPGQRHKNKENYIRDKLANDIEHARAELDNMEVQRLQEEQKASVVREQARYIEQQAWEAVEEMKQALQAAEDADRLKQEAEEGRQKALQEAEAAEMRKKAVEMVEGELYSWQIRKNRTGEYVLTETQLWQLEKALYDHADLQRRVEGLEKKLEQAEHDRDTYRTAMTNLDHFNEQLRMTAAHLSGFWDYYNQYVQSRTAQFESEWNSLADAREKRRNDPMQEDVRYRIPDDKGGWQQSKFGGDAHYSEKEFIMEYKEEAILSGFGMLDELFELAEEKKSKTIQKPDKDLER